MECSALTKEIFAPFGSFTPLVPPEGTPLLEDACIKFWPECGVLDLGPNGNNQAAFGICRVEYRTREVDASEFHTSTGEAILPLDGNIYIHVGPPTVDEVVPIDKIKFFLIPRFTLVVLNPGVWHHAPFTYTTEPVNTLTVLPRRTYVNDCIVKKLKKPLSSNGTSI